MPVKMEVVNPLDNNRVEVKANFDGAYNKRFSVEKDKADEFIASYKKNYNKSSTINMIAMCGFGALGGILFGHFAQNLNGGLKRWGLTAAGGLLGWIIGSMALAKPLRQMEQNVCAKYEAETIKPNRQTTT